MFSEWQEPFQEPNQRPGQSECAELHGRCTLALCRVPGLMQWRLSAPTPAPLQVCLRKSNWRGIANLLLENGAPGCLVFDSPG